MNGEEVKYRVSRQTRKDDKETFTVNETYTFTLTGGKRKGFLYIH